MTASAFDSLTAARKLETAGLERCHAGERAATKADLAGTARELEASIVGVLSKLGVIRWIVGIQSALTLATFAVVAAKLL